MQRINNRRALKLAGLLAIIAMILGVVIVVFNDRNARTGVGHQSDISNSTSVAQTVRSESELPVASTSTNQSPISRSAALQTQIRRRTTEMTDAEKLAFAETFRTRLKPAIERWCKAYEGHIPFAPDSLVPEKLVERVGRNSEYYEYIFVVDGITIGVRDSVRDAGGVPNVAYLNAPKTAKLNTLPSAAAVPTTELPVSRQDVLRMLKAESGKSFSQEDVRMIPSGLGSALNGGVHIEVGGDPNNFLSWEYTLVFGPDKTLVYYGKGADILTKK